MFGWLEVRVAGGASNGDAPRAVVVVLVGEKGRATAWDKPPVTREMRRNPFAGPLCAQGKLKGPDGVRVSLYRAERSTSRVLHAASTPRTNRQVRTIPTRAD